MADNLSNILSYILVVLYMLSLISYVILVVITYIVLPLMCNFSKHMDWCIHRTGNIFTTKYAFLTYNQYFKKFLHSKNELIDLIILQGHITSDGYIVVETDEYTMYMCELGTEFLFYNKSLLVDTYIIRFTSQFEYVKYKLLYKRIMKYCKENNIQEVKV